MAESYLRSSKRRSGGCSGCVRKADAAGDRRGSAGGAISISTMGAKKDTGRCREEGGSASPAAQSV